MPLLEITTNTAINDCAAFAQQASQLTAEILGKPESYVMVKVQAEQIISFAGTHEAAAHIKLKSLGLPEESTTTLSDKICRFINTKLQIENQRIYIEFSNPERHMWGWDNKTFGA